MQFFIDHKDKYSKARAARIVTSKGTIRTPIFMPVGTRASVKSVSQDILDKHIQADIILGNSYHLYMRPGMDILKEAGGLHPFMQWRKPILTDSGGYQVYSLAKRRHISEEGVTFKSHIDGSSHTFTPESVVDIQRIIGSDIMMVLDECTPYPCSYTYAKTSMDRTHRWLQRSIDYIGATTTEFNSHQRLFPIVQGGVYRDLRIQSAETIAQSNQFGNAIGGICHPTGQLYEITELVCSILPYEKPRYLMGVGTPKDILECIALGVDMFDCVMPTRNGRNGMLFTTKGIIHITNKKWKTDFTPIDQDLGGYVSGYYSRAYLNHLINNKELLGAQIASIHNLTFYLWLVRKAREAIEMDNFIPWKNMILKQITQKL